MSLNFLYQCLPFFLNPSDRKNSVRRDCASSWLLIDVCFLRYFVSVVWKLEIKVLWHFLCFDFHYWGELVSLQRLPTIITPYSFFLYFTYHSTAITKILLINTIVKNTLVPVGIWCEDAQPTTPIKHRAIKIREKRTIPSCSRTLRVAPLGLMILLCILCYKQVTTMWLILLYSFQYFYISRLWRTGYVILLTLLPRCLEGNGWPQAQCC